VRHWTRSLAVIVFVIAGCQHALAAQKRVSKNEHQAGAAKRQVSRLKAADAVGLYRWYSGMQMGIFWTQVLNKRRETLGFSAHNEEGFRLGGSPTSTLLAESFPEKRACSTLWLPTNQ
jgi:hypothetical protein